MAENKQGIIATDGEDEIPTITPAQKKLADDMTNLMLRDFIARLEEQKVRLLLSIKEHKEQLNQAQEDQTDIYYYLNKKLDDNYELIGNLETQMLNEQADREISEKIYEKKIEELENKLDSESSRYQGRINDLEAKLHVLTEFQELKDEHDNQLNKLLKTLEDERNNFTKATEAMELKTIKERERLREDFALKIEQMKQQSQIDVEERLSEKTKKTFQENMEIKNELKYQSKQANEVLKMSNMITDRDRDLRNELELAHASEKEMIDRLGQYQYLIKQLSEKCGVDEQKFKEEIESIVNEKDSKDELINKLQLDIQESNEKHQLYREQQGSLWEFLSISFPGVINKIYPGATKAPVDSFTEKERDQVVADLLRRMIRKYPRKFKELMRQAMNKINNGSTGSVIDAGGSLSLPSLFSSQASNIGPFSTGKVPSNGKNGVKKWWETTAEDGDSLVSSLLDGKLDVEGLDKEKDKYRNNSDNKGDNDIEKPQTVSIGTQYPVVVEYPQIEDYIVEEDSQIQNISLSQYARDTENEVYSLDFDDRQSVSVVTGPTSVRSSAAAGSNNEQINIELPGGTGKPNIARPKGSNETQSLIGPSNSTVSRGRSIRNKRNQVKDSSSATHMKVPVEVIGPREAMPTSMRERIVAKNLEATDGLWMQVNTVMPQKHPLAKKIQDNKNNSTISPTTALDSSMNVIDRNSSAGGGSPTPGSRSIRMVQNPPQNASVLFILDDELDADGTTKPPLTADGIIKPSELVSVPNSNESNMSGVDGGNSMDTSLTPQTLDTNLANVTDPGLGLATKSMTIHVAQPSPLNKAPSSASSNRGGSSRARTATPQLGENIDSLAESTTKALLTSENPPLQLAVPGDFIDGESLDELDPKQPMEGLTPDGQGDVNIDVDNAGEPDARGVAAE